MRVPVTAVWKPRPNFFSLSRWLVVIAALEEACHVGEGASGIIVASVEA